MRMELIIASFMIILNCIPSMSVAGIGDILINEIELNPEGDDSGNEWIEIYNPGSEDVILTEYYLMNGGNQKFELSGLVKANGFKVVTFPSQFLDNENEIVSLFNADDVLIDKTPAKTDKPDWGSGDSKTWSRYPDGSDIWEFREGTAGKINKPEVIVNNDPIASFTMSPTSAKAGETITTDASNSKDPDGDNITYEWDWGDGSPKTSGITGTHAYSKAMYYTIRLTVEDELGLEDVTTKRIRIEASSADNNDDDSSDDLMMGCGAVILIVFAIFILVYLFRKKKTTVVTQSPVSEMKKKKKKKKRKKS